MNMESKTKPGKKRIIRVLGALGVTVLLYLAVELCVSWLYDPALDLYPGFSEEIARMNYALYAYDPDLIRRMPPHLDTEHPKSGTPMRTNSRGFRGPEFQDAKAAGVFRILFMGDSCVYGFGLEERDSIPRRVEALMRDAAGGREVESINLAVPGYTSFQGMRQARLLLPRLQPDAVVIGFGFNDSTVRNHTEAEVQASLASGSSAVEGLSDLLSFSPLFELIRNKVRKSSAKSNIGLDSLVIDKKKGPASRVPLAAFEQNIRSILDAVTQSGGRPVLMDINLANHYTHDVLNRIAREEGIDFIDARGELEQAAPSGAYAREAGSGELRTFYVQVQYNPEILKQGGMPFLARLPLGEVRYPMAEILVRDDGKSGDLVEGDGVHTARIEDDGRRDFEFAPAVQLFRAGTFEEAFINYSTFYRLPDPDSLEPRAEYRSPVLRYRRPAFRKFLVDFDLVHPNAAGTERISRALFPVLLRMLHE
jgi:lysophospholipase L1-like esterase